MLLLCGLLQLLCPTRLFAVSWVLEPDIMMMSLINRQPTAEETFLFLARARERSTCLKDCPRTSRTSWLYGGRLLRDEESVQEQSAEVGDACALDTKFWSRGFDYGWFLKELVDAQLLEMSVDVREQVGVFCVKRKDNKQCVIFDTRRANCWFNAPVGVSLASSEALGD